MTIDMAKLNIREQDILPVSHLRDPRLGQEVRHALTANLGIKTGIRMPVVTKYGYHFQNQCSTKYNKYFLESSINNNHTMSDPFSQVY